MCSLLFEPDHCHFTVLEFYYLFSPLCLHVNKRQCQQVTILSATFFHFAAVFLFAIVTPTSPRAVAVATRQFLHFGKHPYTHALNILYHASDTCQLYFEIF